MQFLLNQEPEDIVHEPIDVDKINAMARRFWDDYN